MSSLMNIFRSAPPQQQNQQQQNPGENPPPIVSQGNGGNGISPNNPQPAPTKDQEKVGLDKFSDLFTPATPEELAKQAEGQFDPAKLFHMDPAKITEAVSKMNFVEGVDQSLLAQAAQGGEEGVKALVQIINNVGQNSFKQALVSSTNIVKHGFSQAIPALDGKISSGIRSNNANTELLSQIPAASHQAAQPLLAAIRMQLENKYPTASAKEIAEKAAEFVTEFANSVSPNKVQDSKSTVKPNEDWEKFFNEPLQ